MARRHTPHRADAYGYLNNLPPANVRLSGPNENPPGLTPVFNAAARKIRQTPKQTLPASRVQIQELEKKLSRPAHTAELTPLGNVNGSYDPGRDRKIRHRIRVMENSLAKRNDLARKAFAKASSRNMTHQQKLNRLPRLRM